MTCAIWGTNVIEEKPRTADFCILNSPRAGGWYNVDGSAESMLGALTTAEKRAVTRWLVLQRSMGDRVPELTPWSLEFAKTVPPMKFTAKVNALLLALGVNMDRLDIGLQITTDQALAPTTEELIALTGSEKFNDLFALIKIAKSMGLLSDEGSFIGTIVCSPTATGWERIESLQTKVVMSEQAFVAMWFDSSMDDAYKNGFFPAIDKAGYKPLRIDKKHHVNKIDDEILAEIRRSRFVVSDFSCEPSKVRGGVYFEAGFAMGLGIPVIWTARATSVNDLHFDTRQYNHIVWQTPSELCEQLSMRIGAVIGDGPGRLNRPRPLRALG
jgi:hypothetical protein